MASQFMHMYNVKVGGSVAARVFHNVHIYHCEVVGEAWEDSKPWRGMNRNVLEYHILNKGEVRFEKRRSELKRNTSLAGERVAYQPNALPVATNLTHKNLPSRGKQWT